MKILFVCLGNICRSPMAEFVFKNLVKEKGIEKDFYISSAATDSYTEYYKETMHPGTKNILNLNNIPYTTHYAKRLRKEDYEKYDYILGMEEANIKNILKIIGTDPKSKVHRLLDFTTNPRDIIDPWYYGNFDLTYKDIDEGCNALLNHILNEYKTTNKNY